MIELSLVGIATAFAAGVISFLSPCVLPLVPGYVSFVAGRLCSEPNLIWEIANEAHPESLGNPRASNWQENILKS